MEIGVGQAAVLGELLVAAANEGTAREVVRVAIAGDLLEVLDRAQAVELPRGKTDIGHGSLLEALGIREHVDEELEGAGIASIVLGHDHDHDDDIAADSGDDDTDVSAEGA